MSSLCPGAEQGLLYRYIPGLISRKLVRNLEGAQGGLGGLPPSAWSAFQLPECRKAAVHFTCVPGNGYVTAGTANYNVPNLG